MSSSQVKSKAAVERRMAEHRARQDAEASRIARLAKLGVIVVKSEVFPCS